MAAVNDYRPFGSPLAGEGGSPYGFTGEWWEDDAGLLFLRARYYASTTGRFISRDPWPGSVGRPGTLNRYAYLLNDPINASDPSGKCPPGVPECRDEQGRPIDSYYLPCRPDWPCFFKEQRAAEALAMIHERLHDDEASNPFFEWWWSDYRPAGWWSGYDSTKWSSPYEYDVARRFDPLYGNPYYYDPRFINDSTVSARYALWRSMAGVCWKCHVTHLNNRVPTNAELDPHLIDYYNYMGKHYKLRMYAMLFGSLCNLASMAQMLAAEETVTLYAFRGNPDYIGEHPLIQAGHVGVSFDGGETIYGFWPSEAARAQFAELGIDTMEFLNARGAMAGQVYNDTAVFLRAEELAAQGAGTQVYRLPITVSAEEYAAMQASTLAQVENPSLTQAWYSFPYRTPDKIPLPMPPQCNNCATWPRTLGLQIPEETGWLWRYLEAMKELGATLWRNP